MEAQKIEIPKLFKEQYGHFINNEWVAPASGEYFDNNCPIDNSLIFKTARGNQEDVEKAITAAANAFPAWSKTPAPARSAVLLKIAQVMEDNIELLAKAEVVDKGKPMREALLVDLPVAIDNFRYFAGVIRAEEGGTSMQDEHTLQINQPEALGPVGAIIAWNFPLLLFAWKVAPAIAAGCTIVVKTAEQTPAGANLLMDLLKEADAVPPGVINVVTGFGLEAGKPLAMSPNIAKISFTGETATGRLILQYAAENIIPATMELGGKSPNIFMPSIADKDDDFFDKCIEGAVMFAVNQGEACTCPSRLFVHEDIYDKFMGRVVDRTKAIVQGDPFEMTTMMGAQASKDQYDKILKYIEIGKQEGAKVLCGGDANSDGACDNGYFIQPTILEGNNKMKVFQEEIFGPVVCVTKFKTTEEVLEMANDSIYGLAAAVWTRDAHEAFAMPRAIEAGRVWVNCYHAYPTHAAFGGFKKSGFGRENHKMALASFQRTKNIFQSNAQQKLGFF
ncbi:Aldehyde dehydrogenase [hydrothermal vent metagenome]|uniref:Aldehyde dehydrogenase n=1 Tax=hydrothermal vent metagenome TaxID=652676 RepID=A0A3B0T5Y3_9ZZZZ